MNIPTPEEIKQMRYDYEEVAPISYATRNRIFFVFAVLGIIGLMIGVVYLIYNSDPKLVPNPVGPEDRNFCLANTNGVCTWAERRNCFIKDALVNASTFAVFTQQDATVCQAQLSGSIQEEIVPGLLARLTFTDPAIPPTTEQLNICFSQMLESAADLSKPTAVMQMIQNTQDQVGIVDVFSLDYAQNSKDSYTQLCPVSDFSCLENSGATILFSNEYGAKTLTSSASMCGAL